MLTLICALSCPKNPNKIKLSDVILMIPFFQFPEYTGQNCFNEVTNPFKYKNLKYAINTN